VSEKVLLSTSNVVKSLAAGAPPRTPLRELTALPRPLTGGKGAGCPFPRTTPPVFSIVSFGYASVNYSI